MFTVNLIGKTCLHYQANEIYSQAGKVWLNFSVTVSVLIHIPMTIIWPLSSNFKKDGSGSRTWTGCLGITVTNSLFALTPWISVSKASDKKKVTLWSKRRVIYVKGYEKEPLASVSTIFRWIVFENRSVFREIILTKVHREVENLGIDSFKTRVTYTY